MNRVVRLGLHATGIGTIYPAIYLLLYFLGAEVYFAYLWQIILWPSSIFLMALDGAEQNVSAVITVVGISLLVNAAMWFGVGCAVGGAANLVARLKKGKP